MIVQTAMNTRLMPLFLIALSALPLGAQIGYPGGGVGYPGGGVGYPGGGVGYPGGGVGYPGGRYPGGGGVGYPGGTGPAGRGTNQMPVPLGGIIHRITTLDMELDPNDGRMLEIRFDRTTRFFNEKGGSARLGDFDNGDTVSVDATQDRSNFYHALRVTLVAKAVSNTTTTSSPSSRSKQDDKQASSQSDSSQSDDPDKPVLKRKDNSASASSTPARTPGGDDPDRPVLRRSDSAAGGSSASAQTKEDNDPDRPILRRGGSAEVASVTPMRTPGDDDPDRPILRRSGAGTEATPGDAPRETQQPREQRPPDPVIGSAREAAAMFTETLPNYVVKQFTTRYQTEMARGDRTSWQPLDVVTADVIEENSKETYKNILINGKPTKDPTEKGAWSTGEFSSVQLDLLDPSTDADFYNKRTSTIVNRAAYKYDFTVKKENSHWTIKASAETTVPAYSGSVWIDKENSRVLRIEMQAKNMPSAFPFDQVESALDYDYVNISGQKFLLPAHSENMTCIRGTSECSRNVIEFRNYRKYGSDTSITFEPDK
jgi:hypothetical protein